MSSAPFVRRESGFHDAAKRKIAELLDDRAVNRSGAWVEYPIVKGLGSLLLDEQMYDKKDTLPSVKQSHDDFVPTVEACRSQGYTVIRVVDVAVPAKGNIVEIWEICHKNPLTAEKVNDIVEEVGEDVPIYEISATWVLSQDVDDLNLESAYENATHWSGTDWCSSKVCKVGCAERKKQWEEEKEKKRLANLESENNSLKEELKEVKAKLAEANAKLNAIHKVLAPNVTVRRPKKARSVEDDDDDLGGFIMSDSEDEAPSDGRPKFGSPKFWARAQAEREKRLAPNA